MRDVSSLGSPPVMAYHYICRYLRYGAPPETRGAHLVTGIGLCSETANADRGILFQTLMRLCLEQAHLGRLSLARSTIDEPKGESSSSFAHCAFDLVLRLSETANANRGQSNHQVLRLGLPDAGTIGTTSPGPVKDVNMRDGIVATGASFPDIVLQGVELLHHLPGNVILVVIF